MVKAYHVKGSWRVQIKYSDGSWHTCCWMDGTPYQYASYDDATHAIVEFGKNHEYRAITIKEELAPKLLEALQLLVTARSDNEFTADMIHLAYEKAEQVIAKAFA